MWQHFTFLLIVLFGFHPAFGIVSFSLVVLNGPFVQLNTNQCVQEALQRAIILEMTSPLIFVLCLSAFNGGCIIALMLLCV